MNDFDEFLNSIGLDLHTTVRLDSNATNSRVERADTTVDTTTVALPEPEPEPQRVSIPNNTELSEGDIMDILVENGFNGVEDADAEEIDDEEDEESEEPEEEDSEETSYTEPDSPPLGLGLGMVYPLSADNITISSRVTDELFQVTAVPINSISTDAESESGSETTENHEFFHENSPTLTMDETTSRFSGTEWFEQIQRQSIILAGLGGIGSWTGILLARMNPRYMVLYDDDTVEFGNMSGQMYTSSDVGRTKVAALVDIISDYTNTMHNLYAVNQRFTENTDAGDIMICGFDNMDARKAFFNSWRNHVCDVDDDWKSRCLYIDGRLSIDTLQIFCIRGDDEFNMERYEREFLFNSSDADETVCSMKQTSYLACMISSLIVNMFTNFVANQLDPVIPYDLPFFTEYDSKNVLFKTEN